MFKKLFKKMGLLSKKIKVGQQALNAANSKQEPTKQITEQLTEQEINFILTKLRNSEYKGTEFEMFHNIWMKLSNLK